ncbi:MAG TPA: DUF3365 domain-containing protein [Bacteroidetes bacterium]|nr:DUF3365 domain-containing protein [Bacteroidota bacterium]
MRKSLSIIVLFIAVAMTACTPPAQEDKKGQKPAKTVETETVVASPKPATDPKDVLAKGFSLMESNCFSCHNIDGSKDGLIAPTLAAIKTQYVQAQTTEAEFARELVSFVQNPSLEKAKMPGATKRYGIMPKMDFSQEQLSAIASYIYQTEIEQEAWFENHYQEERKKYAVSIDEQDLSYTEKGLQYAMKTKGVLGKNLLKAIKTKGTIGALSFCNVQAYPLTDSMANALKVSIKRVSDKNRNPANKANAEELRFIANAKKLIAKGEKVKPHTHEMDNNVVGYYPIMTNAMCMQCHGTPKTEVLPETLSKIKDLYPKDAALGYHPNELRGIWVVKMDKAK